MSRGLGVHTVPASEGRFPWCNKFNGVVISRHTSKELAIIAGRETAKSIRTEHVIHKLDGTIGDKNSYGNDPFPPKDAR